MKWEHCKIVVDVTGNGVYPEPYYSYLRAKCNSANTPFIRRKIYFSEYKVGFCKMLEDEGLLVIEKDVTPIYMLSEVKPKEPNSIVYSDSSQEILISVCGGEVYVCGISEERVNAISEKIAEYGILHESPQGSLYMLGERNGEFCLNSIGIVSCDFQEDNYTSDIINGYSEITDNINSDKPFGRLSVLHGPPGTGKSYFIRSLISSVGDATFLYISPSLQDQLTGPKMSRLLLNHSSHFERDYPLVLILEDADAYLAKRDKDNIHRISDILNLTDGLLGDLFNLHIVASTNLGDEPEFDEAIKRPGRMGRFVNFPKLDKDHAIQVFQRLVGNATDGGIDSSKTLAEVYSLALEESTTCNS